MDAGPQTKTPMTPIQIALLVKIYRGAMEWSQETLAELSGLTVRTIQRIEAGQPSSLDTRRALARGFQIPDLDVFCKPSLFPNSEEIAKHKAEFDRKNLVLDAEVADGRKIAMMLKDNQPDGAISSGSTTELSYAGQDTFVAILDFVRELMDVADVASRTEMLGYGDQLDAMIGEMRTVGFCLCLAVRHTSITFKTWTDRTPWDIDVGYLIAAPIYLPPATVAVPRKLGSMTF